MYVYLVSATSFLEGIGYEGVFDTVELAEAACTTINHSVLRFKLNEREAETLDGSYRKPTEEEAWYPLLKLKSVS